VHAINGQDKGLLTGGPIYGILEVGPEKSGILNLDGSQFAPAYTDKGIGRGLGIRWICPPLAESLAKCEKLNAGGKKELLPGGCSRDHIKIARVARIDEAEVTGFLFGYVTAGQAVNRFEGPID
jgi:hypothetical protein